ncbi:glutaredoxin family protein [Jeotgalibaca porci]|uniref:glutaredoxin family protein n=1 Tax=Jeotgalibaca porci TaxID=1868793 RepID=UPI00359F7C8F
MENSTLIIYSKNNCGPCNMMKLHMQENDIDFEERNISTSEIYMQELLDLGCQSVPVIVLDGEVIANGFEPWKLEGLT